MWNAPAPFATTLIAKIFMNDDGGRIFETFKNETGPNATVLARHRIIDDFLRRELAADSRLRVIIIGAGFDSRAYRIEGGGWTEFDEPHLIDYKNARLSVADCGNELRRVPVDKNEAITNSSKPLRAGTDQRFVSNISLILSCAA